MTGPIPINVLIEALNNKETAMRSRAKAALVVCGTPAVEPLIALLRRGTSRQVSEAICILGKIGDSKAIEPLTNMLHTPNLLYRMNAAQALGDLGLPSVIPTLLAALAIKEESEAVQAWLLDSLGKIGDQNVVEPLISFLRESSSPPLRYMTIKALGTLNDPRAIEVIVPFLNDDNRHVREYAREALIRLGYTDIAPEDGG